MNYEVGAMGVAEFCKWSGLGKTKVYAEIKCGKLPVFKVGRRTLIRFDVALDWLSKASS